MAVLSVDPSNVQAAVDAILGELNGRLDRDNLRNGLPFPLPVLTALPSPAFDGQLCLFQTAAMEAAGTPPWLLRYRAKNGDGSVNASAYKWEPFGPPVPLYAAVETDQSTASTVLTDLATVGPDITLPLDGDYLIGLGANMFNSVAASNLQMSFAIGAAAAVAADGIEGSTSGVNAATSQARQAIRKNALTAGTLLRAKYATGSGTGHFRRRYAVVIPERVG